MSVVLARVLGLVLSSTPLEQREEDEETSGGEAADGEAAGGDGEGGGALPSG